MFKSTRVDNFRFFLLNFQIACSFTDFHITFLFQPVPLYPLLSGYGLGFLPTYLGISTHSCMTIVVFLYIYQIACMINCFIRKNQVIAGTLTSYAIPAPLVIRLVSFMAAYTITVAGMYSCLGVAESEKMKFVGENLPEYLSSFQSLPNFSIYEANSLIFIVVITAVTGAFIAFTFFTAILYNIFRMLGFMKLQMSATTYKQHRAAVWSLIAQFATSIICFSPPIFLVFVVFFQLPHAQVIVELLLVVACFHSPANVTVLIFTFPPYRKYVLKNFRSTRLGPISANTSVLVSHLAKHQTSASKNTSFPMFDINFSIAYWLSTYYHIIGVISMIVDLFSIYLILFKSNKLDNFRYFLLNFQITCVFADICVAFLFQPVPLYPLLAGYNMGIGVRYGASLHVGIVSVRRGTQKVSGVAKYISPRESRSMSAADSPNSFYFQFFFQACITFLLCYQIGSMIICFVHKHQTIAGTLKKFNIPKYLLILMFAYFPAYTVSVASIYSRLSVPETLKFGFVATTYPDLLPEFKSLPNFSIYDFSVHFKIFIIYAITGGSIGFIVFSLVLLNIIRMLSQLRLKISKSNYQKHRNAIWSLLAQFATSSTIFLPPIVCSFVILLGFNGSQVIVETFLVLACLHSLLNVLVLVVTCPPYRKFVISLVRKTILFKNLTFKCVAKKFEYLKFSSSPNYSKIHT
nr:hypothetical protein F22E5.15 - Caenorhabditis elegans [Caenorhabditis elegans]